VGQGQFSFILYADGHLVIRGPDGYREGQVSQDEITELLGRVEETGFLQVEGDGSRRELDVIYVGIPDGYLPPDGFPYDDLTILGKRVQIYTALLEYLIPEVQSARDLLLGYAPSSTVPLVPRFLELLIEEYAGAEPPPEGHVATPLPGVMEWPGDLPPVDSLLAGEIDARAVLQSSPELLDLFPALPSSRVIADGGREYLIAACPVLP
jgi:hypothetical protein